jgi:hypothetical protein
MSNVATVGEAFQFLFGSTAVIAAIQTAVIKRFRKFDGPSLLKTFVLGFLGNPNASDDDLAQVAALCGVEVTASAVGQRFTPAMVQFLQTVFQKAALTVVGSDQALAPILARFPQVRLIDGSTVALPDGQAREFPGCGGSYDSGQAALKLQTTLDLRSGAVTVHVEAGRQPDAATPRQHERLGPGSLRIADLGYFNLDVFQAMADAGEYYLSRLQIHTTVYLEETDKSLNERQLMDWLAKQRGGFIVAQVRVGAKHGLGARLIAWRLPKEHAEQRRQQLRADYQRKGKLHRLSAERLAWCDWSILVTNVPPRLMSLAEAVVLYRARWQIELLFKRWKSQNLIAELTGPTEVRQLVRLWSRLLMSLVQHWLVVGSVWGDPRKSLVKACAAVRAFAVPLALALSAGRDALEHVIEALQKLSTKTCQRNSRSDPGTFELLNDPSLLNFRLT